MLGVGGAIRRWKIKSRRSCAFSEVRGKKSEGLSDIVGDTKAPDASSAINVNAHAKLIFAVPTNGEVIFFLEAGDQVLGVLFGSILYT